MNNLSFLGSAISLPPTIMQAHDIDKKIHKPAGWTKNNLGIIQRHFITDNTSSVELAKPAVIKALRQANLSLSDIMERFKALSTRKYIEGIDINGWQPFNGKLWQRNYYEHIIPNEHELNAYRKYTKDNPSKWEEDEYFDDEKNNQGRGQIVI